MCSCSEAEEKTGRYVMSFLEHMKKHLGVHATVFVAYHNKEGEVRVSE